jgi:thymidylate synthase
MNNIDRQYKELSYHILNFGIDKADRTGTGTKSIFGWQIRHNMKDGFPLLTTKKMAWKTMVTELLWFLRGDTNIKFLVDNGCHVWDGDAYKNYLNHTQHEASYTKEQFINLIKTDKDWANVWGELGPIYGKQWRDWNGKDEVKLTSEKDENGYLKFEKNHINGIDQIANLINKIKTNPDSRRLMVSAWNIGELDKMTLPPCHYSFQVYTRELSIEERFKLAKFDWPPGGLPNIGIARLEELNIPTRAISLMWNQRSVDTFLGLPFNIASYGLLLEIIAKEVNMIPDELIGNLGDVHLYNNHIKQAEEQLSRTPYELPKLNINTEWWDKPFIELVMSDNFCKCLLEEDIQLYDYQSHPAIKAPLSN